MAAETLCGSGGSRDVRRYTCRAKQSGGGVNTALGLLPGARGRAARLLSVLRGPKNV